MDTIKSFFMANFIHGRTKWESCLAVVVLGTYVKIEKIMILMKNLGEQTECLEIEIQKLSIR